ALVRCDHFVDRDGHAHAPTPAVKASLCQVESADGDAKVHAFALYRTTLDASGKVASFERFATIDEKNLLAPLTSVVVEGTISARKQDGTYELDPSTPIRVALGAPKVMQAGPAGTTFYEIDGDVVNLDASVTASDGSCMPALSSDAATDPFPGAAHATLKFFRVPSMHLAGDDEGVFEFDADTTSLGTCMGPTWFVGPEALLAAKPPKLAAYDGFGHGTPGDIPNVHLAVVSGGGAACTP
ncbi:MAG TPA: hypothetical protein VHB21_14745, partial [Minicystis sp.]|nr:hypothetical protein [Minicystis sp.]